MGSLGLTGLSLPPALQAEILQKKSVRAKSCILLYMDGGPSHIDMLDMKPAAPAEIRGPLNPISTNVPGIQICDHMPRVAQQMQHIMQIRSVRHQETVHDPAVYQMLTGYKHFSSAGGLEVEETDLPQMGSAFNCADQTRVVMPRVIEVPDQMKMSSRVLPGQNAGILGASFDPFQVQITHEGKLIPPEFDIQQGISRSRLSKRTSLLQQLDPVLEGGRGFAGPNRFSMFQRQALSILSKPSVQQAFDLSRESANTHEQYGQHRNGQSVLLSRRLVEAGAKFVTVYWGNEEQDWADRKPPRLANNPWDTHRNHFPLIKNSLIPRADQTLSALLADLSDRGLLDETLVVWMGDFGRTPRINKQWASRDHWPHAFTILMAGAGIHGGSIYGRTDRHAAHVTDNPVSPADITATIFEALGVDPSLLVSAADGSSHQLSTGRPIDELFG